MVKMNDKINKKTTIISAVFNVAISCFVKAGAFSVMFSLLVGFALVPFARASSHRDSPFISEDPAADNTDVYAFVSTETGRSDYVTVISNFVPLQEPANGPNFYKFSDFVNYDILIDVDGDAKPDLTYRYQFVSRIVDPGTYLYNTNTILPPLNPSDPTSQYVNLNQPQSYTLTEFGRGIPDTGRVLLSNVRTAPNRPGPKSINVAEVGRNGTPLVGDTSVVYQNLAQLAVHTAPNSDGLRSFVGPRDEGFFVDLGTAFDLVNPGTGADGTSGFNISTLAIEIPKARLQAAGDTDGIVGVWSTASRVLLPVCSSPTGNLPCNVGNAGGSLNTNGTQVSRLANPLFNEFLDPVRVKDLYNATDPTKDARNIFLGILNPAAEQGPNTLVQQLKEVIICTDTSRRRDQLYSFMLGYPSGTVNGFPGNYETQKSPVFADELRLNYNIPPSAVANPLGILGGDFAGFPNGRRVTDDSVDILLKLWGGAIQSNFGGTPCPAALALTDNVNVNDVPFLQQFPYLGLPQEGFTHTHIHNQP